MAVSAFAGRIGAIDGQFVSQASCHGFREADAGTVTISDTIYQVPIIIASFWRYHSVSIDFSGR
jgi:hypothetical protein